MRRLWKWLGDRLFGVPDLRPLEGGEREWVQRTRMEAIDRLVRIKTEAEAYLR